MKEIKDGYQETAIGVLPEDWEVKTLKQVCSKIFVGIATSTTEYFTDKGIPLLRNQNIKAGKLDTNDIEYITKEFSIANKSKALQKGDILTVRTGYPGISCVVPTEFEGTQTFTTLISRPIQKNIDSYFLSQYINSSNGKRQLNALKAGGAQQNLNVKSFEVLPIPLPPLPEQQRIAEILSAADAHLEKLDAIIADTQLLKKAMMQSLLTRGIGHTEFRDTEIGEIPKAWEAIKINECVTNIIGGGTPSRSNPEFYCGDIPWITVKDLDNKFYKNDAIEYITEEAITKCSTNLIKENSVIIATRMGLGRGFINTKPVAINQDMKALILNEFVNQRYFLFWYLSNAALIEKLGTGTTVKGIRLEILKDLVLPLPPLPEQHRIAEILSAIDDRIQLYEKEKADFTELKKGLMEQLLTGKIRVN